MNIYLRDVSKVYKNGNRRALNGVSFDICNGLFGLLGPNGAGKTTLMRILTTMLEPSDGSIKVDNFDLIHDRKDVRKMLGYLPQKFSMFSRMKTWEFLDYSARLAGIDSPKERQKKIEELLEAVGLYEARERQANKLSGGMKRRLGIAQALIGSPKILIVDEPTTGLDPEERIRFRNLMAQMSLGDIIIILSTHIVGDISSLCNQMVMLNRGQVVYNGSPGDLVDSTRGHAWCIDAVDSELDAIKSKFPVISTVPSANGWEVEVVGDNTNGYKASPIEPNLEHAYVYLMEYKLGETA